MSGMFQNCCCGTPTNCKIRLLVATKTRHGFPPLYIVSIVTGATFKSKLRFRFKSIDFNEVYNVGGGITVDGYHSFANIDRITGRADYDESAERGPNYLAYQRTTAEAVISASFNTHKDTGSGTVNVNTGDDSDPGGHFISTYTITFQYDGVDIIGVNYVYHEVLTLFGAFQSSLDRTYSVSLANEYEDEMLKADVDDLLRGFATGSSPRLGLDGMTDDTLANISWNENGVNGALGNAVTGACWIAVASLSGYTTPVDPAITVNTTAAATYFAVQGIWWQSGGAGGSFTTYSCSFEDDATMPVVTQTNDSWINEKSVAIRFNISGAICAEWDLIDGAGTTSTQCIVTASSFGVTDVYQPHPVAVVNSNIQRSAGTMRFTSPGALTGGGCPCTAAP